MPANPLADALLRVLLNEFDESEVVLLSQELGVGFRALHGGNAHMKTRAFIALVERRKQTPRLVARVRVYRPDAYVAYGVEAAYRSMRETSRVAPPVRTAIVTVAASLALAMFFHFALAPLPQARELFASGIAPSEVAKPERETPAQAETTTNQTRESAVAAPQPSVPRSAPSRAAESNVQISDPPDVQTSDSPAVIVESLNQQLAAHFNGQWRASQAKALPMATRAGGAASVRFTRKPTVVTTRAGEVVVATREVWRYDGSASAKCETRDVRYTLARQVAGGLTLKNIQSRVVSPRCTPAMAAR